MTLSHASLRGTEHQTSGICDLRAAGVHCCIPGRPSPQLARPWPPIGGHSSYEPGGGATSVAGAAFLPATALTLIARRSCRGHIRARRSSPLASRSAAGRSRSVGRTRQIPARGMALPIHTAHPRAAQSSGSRTARVAQNTRGKAKVMHERMVQLARRAIGPAARGWTTLPCGAGRLSSER